MRKNRVMRRQWLIILALVVSLAVEAAALAYWTDALSIAGTVETGEVDVVFTGASTNDAGSTVDPGQDRDVASSEAAISADSKTVTFTIENSYPGYSAEGYAAFTNTGTIPVKITGIAVDNPNASVVDVTYQVSGLPGDGVLNPGATAQITIFHSVLDGAAESATYSYSVAVNFAQWNASQ